MTYVGHRTPLPPDGSAKASLFESDETVRLRATITVEYDAHVRYYPSPDPLKMAQVDAENLRDGGLQDILEWGDPQINVEPVT